MEQNCTFSVLAIKDRDEKAVSDYLQNEMAFHDELVIVKLCARREHEEVLDMWIPLDLVGLQLRELVAPPQ